MFFEGLATLVLVVCGFIFTEGRSWHRPMMEFIFWTMAISTLILLAVFSRDSPILYIISVNPHPFSKLVVVVAVFLYSAFMAGHFFASRLVSFQDHQGTDRFRSQLIEAASRKSQSRADESRASFRKSRGLSSRQLLDYESRSVNEAVLRAKSKQEYVTRTLYRLAYSSQMRRFAAMLRGHIDERQGAIKKVLEDSTPGELNHIIGHINVPRLFTFGTDPRKVDNVLRYIVEERHSELTTIARASVLHGIMKTDTLQFFAREREWASTVFCGAEGVQLSLLKNMLDSSGDFNNLYKFIYIDIADDAQRKKILKHIEKQGKITKANFELTGHRPLKVLSDVDDTMSSSGGSFPAGADGRYPKHAIYPGVLALYREIDVAARASSNLNADESKSDQTRNGDKVKITVHVPWKQGGGETSFDAKVTASILDVQTKVQAKYNIVPDHQELSVSQSKSLPNPTSEDINSWQDGNLVFVSARPHVFRDVAENASYRRFHKMVHEGRMHATPTMLSGNLKAGMSAIAFRYWEKLQLFFLDIFDFLIAMTDLTKRKMTEKKSKKKDKKNATMLPKLDAGDIDNYDEEITAGGDADLRSELLARTDSTMRQITNKNWELVGRTKVASMEKYSNLYPEYEIVFFGDNGQGDLLAAEAMSNDSTCKDKVRMCFIHRIQSNECNSLLSIFKPDEREKKWKKNNIVFFDTYVEAAALAHESGLISLEALHRVGICVHDELMDIFLRHPYRDWIDVLRVTREDIERANTLLKPAGLSIPTPVLPDAIMRR